MKLLLDTHVFLWTITNNRKLSGTASRIILDHRNELFLSTASVWEILLKAQIGKLSLPKPEAGFLQNQLAQNAIESLPLRLEHVLCLEKLPMHHRDPFDRILIAQAIAESVPIVTADRQFARYDVDTMW